MAASYFTKVRGQTYGPFSSAELKQFALEGRLTREDFICVNGSQNWVAASNVKGLFPANEIVVANSNPAPPPLAYPTTSPIVEPAQPTYPSAPYQQPYNDPWQQAPSPYPQAMPQQPYVQPAYAPVPIGQPVYAPQPYADPGYPQQSFPQPGYPQPVYPTPVYQQPQAPTHIIVEHVVRTRPARSRGSKKSVALAIFLAFMFGPLGMCYSTTTGALVIFLLNVALFIPTAGLIVLITLPAGCIWAAVAAGDS